MPNLKNGQPFIVPNGVGGNGSIVPNSASDADITSGLFDDLQYQASNWFDKSDEDVAKANYLNWLLTQNQRQFDTQWRDNERQYTSPVQQLQRLMATGMSYSAALAMLQGSGEAGSTSGTTAPVAAAGNSANDIANVFSGVSSIASTFGGLFSIFAGAASLGINLDLLRSQADAQNMANYQTKMFNQGLDIANNFMGLVHSAHNYSPLTDYTDPNTGQISQRHEFDPTQYQSFDELLTNFSKYAPNYPDAANFLNAGGLRQLEGNYYARQFAESMFNNRWNTAGVKNTPEQLLKASQAAYAKSIAESLQAKITQADLDLLYQQIKLKRPDVIRADAESYALYYAQNPETAAMNATNIEDVGGLNMSGYADEEGFPHDTTYTNPLVSAYLEEISSYFISASKLPFQSELQNNYIIAALKNAIADENLRSHLIALDTAFYGNATPEMMESEFGKWKILWDKLGFGTALHSVLKVIPKVGKYIPSKKDKKADNQQEVSVPLP